MNIILLASNSKLYSNQRIIEAARKAGHTISFVNIKDCYINITSHKPEIYYKSKKLENIEFQRLQNLFNKIDLTNVKQVPACPDASSHYFFIKSKSNQTFEWCGMYSDSNYDLDYFYLYMIFIEAKTNFKLSDRKDVKFRNKLSEGDMSIK